MQINDIVINPDFKKELGLQILLTQTDIGLFKEIIGIVPMNQLSPQARDMLWILHGSVRGV